jgi:hypothetical protein
VNNSAAQGAAANRSICPRSTGRSAAHGKGAAPNSPLQEFYAETRKRLKKRQKTRETFA